MKTLSVAGTAAMFLVGGGILVHGVPALHHAVVVFGAAGGAADWLLEALANALTGVVAGAVLVLAWRLAAPAGAPEDHVTGPRGWRAGCRITG